MAININIPNDPAPQASGAMTAKGNVIQGMLGGGHTPPLAAPDENSLVAAAFGFMPHRFAPTDLATGGLFHGGM